MPFSVYGVEGGAAVDLLLPSLKVSHSIPPAAVASFSPPQ